MTFQSSAGIAALLLMTATAAAQTPPAQDADHNAHHQPAETAKPAQANGPAMMGGGSAGMMGGGMMMGQGMGGPGGMMQGGGFADPSGYLGSLKGELAITAQQDKAWNDYADVVKGTAEQMRTVHKGMYQSMGTQSWQQRRDAMNQMFAARQQAYGKVHDAATQLTAVLDDAQKAKAQQSLPGLAARGHSMMQGR